MRIALVALTVLLLTGCAAEAPVATDPPVAEETPEPSPTPTPEGPVADDPALYPTDGSDALVGVRFTAAGGALQCGIFDPAEMVRTAPFFGCLVNVDGYPYPAVPDGPGDHANAFLSWGHEPGHPGFITDSTMSGLGTPAALPAGHSVTWSSVTCEALADDEIRCVDAVSQHGMRVSAADYEVF